MDNKRKGFTLVELLAVIFVLGLILIIAVPKVQDTMYNSKKKTLELTVKSIARSAEEAYLEYDSFGMIDEITCESVADISSNDYESCEIDFDEEGKASVTYVGKGSYEGLKVCDGTKTNAITTEERCAAKPVNFENDDWYSIVAAVKSGNYPYKVGDAKIIDLGELGEHTIRVSNTSACDGTLESETACGFVLEFADIIALKGMNDNESTNAGGWPATTMRTYLNGTIYDALPEDLKNGIIDTVVVSGHGSTEGESNFISEDKLYLLSPMELWGSNPGYDTAATIEITRQLDYYTLKNVTISNCGDAIKKYNSTASFWWLRSARSINNDTFFYVFHGGASNNNGAVAAYGVSPAFRIG